MSMAAGGTNLVRVYTWPLNGVLSSLAAMVISLQLWNKGGEEKRMLVQEDKSRGLDWAKVKKKWGKCLRVVFGRTAFVMLFLLIQIVVLLGAFKWVSDQLFYIYGGFTLLSAAVVIYIINRRQNPVYQLAWVIPVLVFPVFGAMFYIFLQMQVGTKKIATRLEILLHATGGYLQQDGGTFARLEQESRREAMLARYMNNYGGYPVYDGTSVEYFPLGDDMFPRMKEELLKARHYIFMEYFIIGQGRMWYEILEILEEKARAGVEVRVMYDGMCSLALLPYGYPKQLAKKGIRCKMFSPVRPALSTYQNNRDHRKITVIDGHTAFTGGINLADEYINEEERFGHWKDTAVMLKGRAVNSFLMMFLQMWNISEQQSENYEKYMRISRSVSRKIDEIEQMGGPPVPCCGGYVMPYGDSPLDDETVGEHVYLDILNEALFYVHIMTPYLILDSDMITALTFAAKRGVDVTIIMPHIPDKEYAYLLARSYYLELIQAGVKIYEYTPGFLHAKVFVCDDERAVVGSVNLDFRSMYLHFECAAYIYKNDVIHVIEKDFTDTLKKCQLITADACTSYPLVKRMVGSVLRLFAPLM